MNSYKLKQMLRRELKAIKETPISLFEELKSLKAYLFYRFKKKESIKFMVVFK